MVLKEWIGRSENIFTYRDLQFLLRQVFHDKDILFKQNNIYLSKKRVDCLERIKKLYKKGMPVAYLVGKEEFFGLEFKVNPAVLVPRQETEVVTEKAIETIKKNNLRHILDLCCGSANIAISIKKVFNEKTEIVAADVSAKALSVARENIAHHNVNIKTIISNLFEKIKGKKFDLIVSNPPYVASQEIKGSLVHEPEIALLGGEDGLGLIIRILTTAHKYLKDNGFLIIEAGYNQKSPIAAILEKIGKYEIIEWIKDYGGNFRGVILQTKDPRVRNEVKPPRRGQQTADNKFKNCFGLKSEV